MKFKYLLQWLRPKSATDAAKTKHRIAMVYAFFGWNSFIYFFYLAFLRDTSADPAERKTLILGKMIKDQKCYSIHLDGLTLVPSGSHVQGKDPKPPNLQANTMGE